MSRLRLFLSVLRPTRLSVLFAVLIGLGVGFWQWGKPPKPRVVLENLGSDFRASFSPNGRTLATFDGAEPGKPDSSLTFWDVETGQKKFGFFRDKFLWAVAFSRDSQTCACRFEEQIRVLDLTSGRELTTYDDKDGAWFRHLVFSPDGKLLAVRKDFALWDVGDNKIVKNLVLDGEDVIHARGDCGIFLVVGKSCIVKVWDLRTATLCGELKDVFSFPEDFPSAEITSDRRFLTFKTGAFSFWVSIYDLASGKKQILPVEDHHLNNAAIAPDGKTVALEPEPSTQSPQKSFLEIVGEWLGIKRDPTAKYVSLNAFPSGEEIIVLKDCYSPVFAPDGTTLATIGADQTSLQLWDLPIRKLIGKILAQAGLAALATLLALNGLGWLRRRREKKHAHLIASGSAVQVPMPETK